MIGRVAGLCLLVPLLGCAPAWHTGEERFKVWHTIRRAVVYNDSLSIQGVINPILAFTDYGVKVNEVTDDTGTRLPFRSYQTFWAKELCFELECAAPGPAARTVDIDVAFLTRSGKQVVRKELPVVRGVEPSYATQLRAWTVRKPVER